jgi:hypothetical protein
MARLPLVMGAGNHDCTSEPLVGHADRIASVSTAGAGRADGVANVQRSSAVVHTLSIGVTQDQKPHVVRTFQSTANDLRTGIVERVRRRVRAAIARVVARVPSGHPREYDWDAIIGVAKDLIAEDLVRKRGGDNSLDGLIRRVRFECRQRRPRIRTPSSRSQMREILQSTFDDARAQRTKK